MTELCEKDIPTTEETVTSDKHIHLIGYYNYTVILTYIGMFVGFIGITFAFEKQIPQALLCLIISGFCDMFDGTIAATMKRTAKEKKFGIQIDSLSDLICFGVLPALTVSVQIESNVKIWVCGTYVLCALIRLAYFNIDEEERQSTTEEKRVYYKGLPVTSIALILPLIYNQPFSDQVTLGILLGTSVAFIMPLEIKKPGSLMKLGLMGLGAFGFLKVLMVLI